MTDAQSGAARLRALAHPVRLHAIELLEQRGPLTATEMSAETGLSPSAMSYHLRHLAKHGILEPAPSSNRRDVRWQLTDADLFYRGENPDRPSALALAAGVEESVRRSFDRWRRIVTAGQHGAGVMLSSTVWASPQRLTEVYDEVAAVLASLPTERPDGAADEDQKSVFFLALPVVGGPRETDPTRR